MTPEERTKKIVELDVEIHHLRLQASCMIDIEKRNELLEKAGFLEGEAVGLCVTPLS